MSNEDDDKRNSDNPLPQPNRGYRDKEDEMRLWAILGFGIIGATVAVTRRTVNWVYSQLSRSQSSWKDRRSFRATFQEEAWKRYTRRMQEEYEEEMERVCSKRWPRRCQPCRFWPRKKKDGAILSYLCTQISGSYNQNFQRNDWYWKAETSSRDHSSNYRDIPRANASVPLSHHYSVLGLDRLRQNPYTDDEIKSAFRTKAKEFHPDQNQDNKEFAEAKFKEVMVSYEAIKSERKK